MDIENDDMLFTNRIAAALAAVRGVVGCVLGGSRARGTESPDSDYDIGVYYDAATLDLDSLNSAAKALDDDRRDNLIAPPGSWGGWVDGGAWLAVEGRRVDFILRDIHRVEQSVDDCHAGRVEANYQTGHPHAFLNIMYAAELAICRILTDETAALAPLRARMHPYPRQLKKAILHFFGFEMGFSLTLAATYADKDDSYYVAAHIIRSISCMNQVVFALNDQYCVNEKKAIRMADAFPVKPPRYGKRIDEVVALTNRSGGPACEALKSLVDEVGTMIRRHDESFNLAR